MDFGDKLRSLRELRKLSTTQLSKASGVSQSFISDIENKRRKSPTKDTIEKLAKALRISPMYFFDDDARTPLDIMPNMPVDLKGFVIDLENMPYMKVTKKAKENGISAEMLDSLIDTLSDAKTKLRK